MRGKDAPCNWLESGCTVLKVGAWQVGPRLAGPRVGTSLAGEPGVTPRDDRLLVNGVDTAGLLLGSAPSASIYKQTLNNMQYVTSNTIKLQFYIFNSRKSNNMIRLY